MALPHMPVAQPSPSAAGRVWTQRVTSYPALLGLRDEWDRLAGEAGLDHPFLEFEWVRTWWECFGAGRQMEVIVARDDAGVVAIAPMMLGPARAYGLPARELCFLYSDHTPRFDFLIGRRAAEACRAIWEQVWEMRSRWDVVRLPQLPADSASVETLAGLARGQGLRSGIWRSTRSPVVRLPETWDAYLRTLNSHRRANLRRRMERLGQVGPVKLEVIGGGPALEAALEEGFDLEARAWKGEQGTAIASDRALRRFYSEIARRFAERGWLALEFLRVGDRRIAFNYCVVHGRRMFLLKPGYDPAYATHAPGTMLCQLMMQDAIERGLGELDLLGEADSWKLDWTREAREHVWLFIFNRTAAGRALYEAKFRLAPWARRRFSGLRRLPERLAGVGKGACSLAGRAAGAIRTGAEKERTRDSR